MERQFVESTNLVSVGYDSDSSTLEVEFKSGAIWQYYDVLEATYLEMKEASSIGSFFNRSIRGQYSESRVG